MLFIPQWFSRRNEEGQGLVEYGLILILIAVAVVVIMSLLGNQIDGAFQNVSGTLNQALNK